VILAAIEVFVRLQSASGGRPTIGFATPEAHPQGGYDAQVAVPEGGIGGVQIGLRGTSDGGPSERAVPAGERPVGRSGPWGGRRAGDDLGAALAGVVGAGGALGLLGMLGAVVWRARWMTAGVAGWRSRRLDARSAGSAPAYPGRVGRRWGRPGVAGTGSGAGVERTRRRAANSSIGEAVTMVAPASRASWRSSSTRRVLV
jgi:hypothetical protein